MHKIKVGELGPLECMGRELGFNDSQSEARRRYVWRVCDNCHQGKWIVKKRKPAATHLCRHCYATRRIGEANPWWQGGRFLRSGYLVIKLKPDDPFYPMVTKDGYIPEHRLIMARKVGRCLLSTEDVHHIDGNKLNNSELNLELSMHISHKKSYRQAYQDGFRAGQRIRIANLEKELRLLRFMVKELQNQLQTSFVEGAK